MASICCSPPLNVPPAWNLRSARIGNSENTYSRSCNLRFIRRRKPHIDFPAPSAARIYISLGNLANTQRNDAIGAHLSYGFTSEQNLRSEVESRRKSTSTSGELLPAPLAPISDYLTTFISKTDTFQRLNIAVIGMDITQFKHRYPHPGTLLSPQDRADSRGEPSAIFPP